MAERSHGYIEKMEKVGKLCCSDKWQGGSFMSKTVGIIAEYNPFHNGHLYHLQKAKQEANADYCIAVISGNFTQRGDTSITNKWTKAQMAIDGGADLVIELPTIYSVSSAENFASGAIKILDSLKIVDSLAFGAETDDLVALNNIANVLYEEPNEYIKLLNQELEKGISFPVARDNALMMYLDDSKKYSDILNSPNNILAIEYLKALKIQKSNIGPIIIKREKVSYGDDEIIDNFASATGIRELLRKEEYKKVEEVVPKSTYKILEQQKEKGELVLGLAKYEKEIIYTLRKMKISEIADLPDVAEGLENAIKSAANNCNNLPDLINSIKSKRYTQTRIQRILVYALLGINKEMMEASKTVTPYVRVLGFNQKGKKLLSEITTKNPKINIVTSVKKYVDQNQNKQLSEMLDLDIWATNVYTLGNEKKSKANLDFTNNMIIVN